MKTWNDLCAAYETFVGVHGEDAADKPLRIAHWSDRSRNDIDIIYDQDENVMIVTLPKDMME